MSDIEWRKIYLKNNEITKYSISNTGVVRNDERDRILKTATDSWGYEIVGLTHNGKERNVFIHILVATAFIPNPENKPEVNHKDGIKSHNYVSNLEWVTTSENILHAYKTGLRKNRKKHNKRPSKETVELVCKLLEENELSQKQIGDICGVSRQFVGKILHGDSPKIYENIISKYDISKYEIKKNFAKHGDDSEVTKFPDKLIEEVCKMIDSGLYSLKEISEITQVDYQTVRNVYYGVCRRSIAKKYKFFNSDSRPLHEQKKQLIIEACELLDTGLNTRQVAEQLQMSRSIVRKVYSGETWREVSKNYNFMKNKMPNTW